MLGSSSPCPLVVPLCRLSTGLYRVSCFVSFSSSSDLFRFLISGLCFSDVEPFGVCVFRGCRTTLAFMARGVCSRDDILGLLAFA